VAATAARRRAGPGDRWPGALRGIRLSIATAVEPPARESPWVPLSESAFRPIWIAGVVSDIGGAMQNAGAGWLMTSLSANPLVVTLVQAATMLPMFLLLLPAGALADIVDRRKLLLVGEAWGVVTALAMALVAWNGAMTPEILLALTFVLAMGAA